MNYIMIGCILADFQNKIPKEDWIQWLSKEPDISNAAFFSNIDGSTESIKNFNTIINQLKTIKKNIWIMVNIFAAVKGYVSNDKIRINPFNIYSFPKATTTTIKVIQERITDIDRISLEFNPALGSGGFNRWILGNSYLNILRDPINRSINPTLAEMQHTASLIPDIFAAGKLAFPTMIDVPFEREAFIHKEDLSQAKILSWMKKHNVTVNINRGPWVLDKDITEHDKWYRITHTDRSPVIVYSNNYASGPHPYAYYQNYLRSGAEFHSGIGHHKGVKRGNAKNLLNVGYKNTWLHWTPEITAAWQAYKKQISNLSA